MTDQPHWPTANRPDPDPTPVSASTRRWPEAALVAMALVAIGLALVGTTNMWSTSTFADATRARHATVDTTVETLLHAGLDGVYDQPDPDRIPTLLTERLPAVPAPVAVGPAHTNPDGDVAFVVRVGDTAHPQAVLCVAHTATGTHVYRYTRSIDVRLPDISDPIGSTGPESAVPHFDCDTLPGTTSRSAFVSPQPLLP